MDIFAFTFPLDLADEHRRGAVELFGQFSVALASEHWAGAGVGHDSKYAVEQIRPQLGTIEAMVRNGLLVTSQTFQNLNGWKSQQAVWKAAESQRVFYLSHKMERYFPVFYCDPTYDREQLELVTKVLGDLPSGSKLQFFLTGKGSLNGDTPLRALMDGQIAKVLNVASAFAEAREDDSSPSR